MCKLRSVCVKLSHLNATPIPASLKGLSVHVDFQLIVRIFDFRFVLVSKFGLLMCSFNGVLVASLWKQPSLLFRHRLCCWWKHVTWRDWLIDSNVKTNAHHVTDKSHADCPGMSLCDRSSCAANDSWWFPVLISCLWFEGCFPPVSNNTGKQDGKIFWVYQYTDWMNNQKSLAIYPFNILRKVSAN